MTGWSAGGEEAGTSTFHLPVPVLNRPVAFTSRRPPTGTTRVTNRRSAGLPQMALSTRVPLCLKETGVVIELRTPPEIVTVVLSGLEQPILRICSRRACCVLDSAARVCEMNRAGVGEVEKVLQRIRSVVRRERGPNKPNFAQSPGLVTEIAGEFIRLNVGPVKIRSVHLYKSRLTSSRPV